MAIIGKRLIVSGADWADVAIDSEGSTEPIVYTITSNITNGTATGSTTITQGGTATITISANSGYNLPEMSAISVVNATIVSYSGGVLTISNPIGNVTITATCEIIESGGIDEEIDITSEFTWESQGAIVVDPDNGNYGGAQTNQTVYRYNKTYADISAYEAEISSGATLYISFPYAINTAHTKYGLIFYSAETKTDIVGTVAMEYDAVYFNQYRVYEAAIPIPAGSKYIRTTWIPEANVTELGAVFSAKIKTDS